MKFVKINEFLQKKCRVFTKKFVKTLQKKCRNFYKF